MNSTRFDGFPIFPTDVIMPIGESFVHKITS